MGDTRLKNIENKSVSESAAALARLEAALGRLERAAGNRAGAAAPDVVALREEAAALARRHEALRKSAGQVAVRLDETISRLTAFMDTEG